MAFVGPAAGLLWRDTLGSGKKLNTDGFQKVILGYYIWARMIPARSDPIYLPMSKVVLTENEVARALLECGEGGLGMSREPAGGWGWGWELASNMGAWQLCTQLVAQRDT